MKLCARCENGEHDKCRRAQGLYDCGCELCWRSKTTPAAAPAPPTEPAPPHPPVVEAVCWCSYFVPEMGEPDVEVFFRMSDGTLRLFDERGKVVPVARLPQPGLDPNSRTARELGSRAYQYGQHVGDWIEVR